MRDASVGIPWIGSIAACSREGGFHACEGGFRQCRHDDTGAGGLLLNFVENCQETSERDTAN
jgi:hypothetical protein